MIVGSIGSQNRLEYTVIGNNVNLAARFTSLAAGGEILCDKETAAAVSEWAAVVNRGPDYIKGRSQPVAIFEIAGMKKPAGSSSATRGSEVAARSDK
jgi:class 3 adenylate cyclase